MMIDTDSMSERYPHIRFARQWRVESELSYALGQSDSIVEAIGGLPLLGSIPAGALSEAVAQAEEIMESNQILPQYLASGENRD